MAGIRASPGGSRYLRNASILLSHRLAGSPDRAAARASGSAGGGGSPSPRDDGGKTVLPARGIRRGSSSPLAAEGPVNGVLWFGKRSASALPGRGLPDTMGAVEQRPRERRCIRSWQWLDSGLFHASFADEEAGDIHSLLDRGLRPAGMQTCSRCGFGRSWAAGRGSDQAHAIDVKL